jgi:RND family efflux transporter MFP subunit
VHALADAEITKGQNMNALLRGLLPLVVVGGGAAGYAALHATKPAPETNDEPPRAVSVFVEPVRRSPMRLDVVSFGEVRARTDAVLVAQVAGRIVSISPEFIEGGQFSAGDALVVIDDSDHRLALQHAFAEVADAELGLQQALAAADVARRQLAGKPDPSPLALHEPQVAQARARLDASRARVAQAHLDLERTHINLPFHGRIHSTDVNVGQFVTPGVRLGRAFAVDSAEVRIPLTDSQLGSLGLPIGHTADNTLRRRVRLTATLGGEEQEWHGDLLRIDAAVDPSTRLVHGLVRIADPYGAGASARGMPLAVGLYVRAEIEGRQEHDARVIPREALRAGNQVFAVGEDGLLRVRQVVLEHSDKISAVIASGLSPGEQVVVSSIRNPIEGMRVTPLLRGEMAAGAEAAAQRPES